MRLLWIFAVIMCGFSLLFSVMCTGFVLAQAQSAREMLIGPVQIRMEGRTSVPTAREIVDALYLFVGAVFGAIIGPIWACVWAVFAFGAYNSFTAEDDHKVTMYVLRAIYRGGEKALLSRRIGDKEPESVEEWLSKRDANAKQKNRWTSKHW